MKYFLKMLFSYKYFHKKKLINARKNKLGSLYFSIKMSFFLLNNQLI